MADDPGTFSYDYGTVAINITGDKDSAALIEFIGRYIDDENALSEPSSLMEFLDIYTGVVLRELEGRGINTPFISVYDPRAIKEVRLTLRVVCHALNAISEVLDEKAKKLSHDHMRDLMMEYVGAVCDYYESSGVRQRFTLHTLAAPDAVDAFNRAVNDFSPGERPYYFVEHVIGLR